MQISQHANEMGAVPGEEMERRGQGSRFFRFQLARPLPFPERNPTPSFPFPFPFLLIGFHPMNLSILTFETNEIE